MSSTGLSIDECSGGPSLATEHATEHATDHAVQRLPVAGGVCFIIIICIFYIDCTPSQLATLVFTSPSQEHGVRVIRPLNYVREQLTREFAHARALPVITGVRYIEYIHSVACICFVVGLIVVECVLTRELNCCRVCSRELARARVMRVLMTENCPGCFERGNDNFLCK